MRPDDLFALAENRRRPGCGGPMGAEIDVAPPKVGKVLIRITDTGVPVPIDQGAADSFLDGQLKDGQLKPWLFAAKVARLGHPVTRHPQARKDGPMTIYVDADACPVKAEIERVGTRHGLRVVIVSNGGLRPSANPLIETVIVAQGPDEADKWIAERAGPGDVVITGDIPLAAKSIAAGAQVLKHNGEVLSADNIGTVLAMRDLMADLRAADPFLQGRGHSFTKADRSRFLDALDRAVRRAVR